MTDSGQKHDSIPLSKADYEVLVRDGLRNIGLLATLASEAESIQPAAESLSSIYAQLVRVSSHLNRWKLIT